MVSMKPQVEGGEKIRKKGKSEGGRGEKRVGGGRRE